MKDNEIAGMGNSIDYKARMYDPRTARFKSIDPLTAQFPFYTPYQFAGNTPIMAIDLDGLEPASMIDENGKLTAPMIALYNSGLGYRRNAMRNVAWKPANTDFHAQTMGNAIKYGSYFKNPDPGFESKGRWFGFWARLTGHEHSHRDEYTMASFPVWGIQYLLETTYHYFKDGRKEFYSKDVSSEQVAYGGQANVNALFNFSEGFAVKVLESNYDEGTKVGLMNYVGKSYQLSQAKEGSRKAERLEKQIAGLEAKYSSQITVLNAKEARHVDLVEEPDKQKFDKP